MNLFHECFPSMGEPEYGTFSFHDQESLLSHPVFKEHSDQKDFVGYRNDKIREEYILAFKKDGSFLRVGWAEPPFILKTT